CQQVYSNPLTF
nr:immunoglobulin light chain junction region [Macaca mulatta]MOV79218.1 immunoglobulin light chain junction region [Macaca mulatta]MOV82927.1 immunoglobulin light chain junction region [Macaca mulatta]MOW41459.1 immunoglobulin light chain junction region [Macaca mulatta]MOW41935.1 immunoglobulin light chain junction region [Macaca mulatta]